MDGAAASPSAAEEDPSGSGAVDLDPRRPDASPAMIVPEEGKKVEGQGYVDSCLRFSLQLLWKGYAPQVRHQGLKLMLHLLRFRWDELRVEEWRAGRHYLFVAPDPEVVASAVNPASATNSTEKGNDGALVCVSDDICDRIMDASFKIILEKSAAKSHELNLSSDELHGKKIHQCSILLDLIRFIAHERPNVAASRAVQRITYIIDVTSVSKYPKDMEALESAQLVLETVVSAIFDDSTQMTLDTEFLLQRLYNIFEGLLLKLLSLKWTEPSFVVILRYYLNVLCPFVKHFPNAVAIVVAKLFEVLSSISDDCHDPSKAQDARLQICQCIIHVCQSVDRTSLHSDIKELFSIPHVTEENVLAFVAMNRIAHPVEQKQEWGQGSQDGDAVHPFYAHRILSPPSSYLTQGLHPWVLNCENPGLCALSYFHDLPTAQTSLASCSVPSFPNSNGTLSQKKLDHNLFHRPELYYPSFPLYSSMPISCLRLGTKFQNRNEVKSLNRNPENQISTESCSSSSLAYSSSCSALVKQGQQLHANGEFQTEVSSLMQVGEIEPINLFDDCGQGNDQVRNTYGTVTDD